MRGLTSAGRMVSVGVDSHAGAFRMLSSAVGDVVQDGSFDVSGPSNTQAPLWVHPQSAAYTASLLNVDTAKAGDVDFK